MLLKVIDTFSGRTTTSKTTNCKFISHKIYKSPYSFISINMKKGVLLYPRERRYLTEVGKQIRLARLRRRISCDLCAERAKISRAALWKIEKGDPSVSMGAYLSVLFALRLERNILLLAREDQMGHEMQDARMLIGR